MTPKYFDQILSEMLTAWQGGIAGVATDTDSVVGIKSAVLAAQIDAIYRYIESVTGVTPDSCGVEMLGRWARLLGISPIDPQNGSPYSDTMVRQLVADKLRAAPAGGNNGDWYDWVFATYTSPFNVIEWGNGVGSVVVVLDKGATPADKTRVLNAVEASRPVGIADISVVSAVSLATVWTITYSGPMNEGKVLAKVKALYKSIKPGAPIHKARLIGAAIDCGAFGADAVSTADTVGGWTSTIGSGTGLGSWCQLDPDQLTIKFVRI